MIGDLIREQQKLPNEKLIQGNKNTQILGAGVEPALAMMVLFFELQHDDKEQKKGG